MIKQLFIVVFVLMCALWGCKKTDPLRNPDDQEITDDPGDTDDQEPDDDPEPGEDPGDIGGPAYGDDQVISIPDPVFEKALAAYDSDETINGRLLYKDIKDVDSLFISAGYQNPFGGTRDTTKSASDLTGIEYFTNLKSLTVETSKLSSLDLTQNKKLEYLNCSGYYKTEVYYRGLKKLTLPPSNRLKTLICDYTLLEELPLEGFPNLRRLSFMTSEKLRDVKVDKNLNLTNLTGNMQAPPMDLTHNEKLQSLTGMVKINQQTLKNKPGLRFVDATTSDDIEELSFCENPKLTNLYVLSGKLARVTVPAGIRKENIKVQSQAAATVSRCP